MLNPNTIKIFKIEKLFIFFYIFGLTLSIFEILIASNPMIAKTSNTFPAIRILSFTFTIFELFVFSFVVLFLFLIFIKQVYQKKLSFSLAPSKLMNWTIIIFIIFTFSAIVLGGVQKHEEFLPRFRVHLILLVFIPISYFRNEIYKHRSYVFFLFNIVGLFFAFKCIINYFFENLDLRYNLYYIIFTFTYYFSKSLFFRISLWSLLNLSITFISLALSLSEKPVILSTFVSILTIFLIHNVVFKKISLRYLLIIVFSMLTLVLFFSSKTIKSNVTVSAVDRWFLSDLQQDENSSNKEIIQVIIDGVTKKDLSSGRFELWYNYTLEGLKNPIISPNFGKKLSTYISLTKQKHEWNPHNIIVYYIYNVGIVAALCVMILIISFILKGWRCLKYRYMNIKSKGNNLHYFEAVSIYAFVIGLISTEMIGGVIRSNPTITWMTWSLVVIFFVYAKSQSINQKNKN